MGENVMDIARLIATRDASAIVTCPAGATVRQAVELLAEKRIGALPVMQGGQLAGIFSERDVLYRLAEEGALCLDRQVGEVMTSPPVTIGPEARFIDALALMTKRRIRHLPVMSQGAMVGFISIGDIVKMRIDEVTAEAEHMRQYIQTA
jgi:CBS domain-containing protein